jgi:hypothetical protein
MTDGASASRTHVLVEVFRALPGAGPGHKFVFKVEEMVDAQLIANSLSFVPAYGPVAIWENGRLVSMIMRGSAYTPPPPGATGPGPG